MGAAGSVADAEAAAEATDDMMSSACAGSDVGDSAHCMSGLPSDEEDSPRTCRFCGVRLSSSSSHKGLVRNLDKNLLLRSEEARAAYAAVDRGDFAPEGSDPYADVAVPLGSGAQISAPHVHATALTLLAEALLRQLKQRDGAAEAQPGDAARFRVLDLGSGSGYMSAAIARLCAPAGLRILACEHIEELTESARHNIARNHSDLLKPNGPLEVICGDMYEVACRPELQGACDLVHVGASLASAEEPWLTSLLRPGVGRAVAPVGPTDAPQWLSTIDRREDGSVEVRQHIRVLYVPFTSADDQRRRGKVWDEVIERCCRNADAVLRPPC